LAGSQPKKFCNLRDTILDCCFPYFHAKFLNRYVALDSSSFKQSYLLLLAGPVHGRNAKELAARGSFSLLADAWQFPMQWRATRHYLRLEDVKSATSYGVDIHCDCTSISHSCSPFCLLDSCSIDVGTRPHTDAVLYVARAQIPSNESSPNEKDVDLEVGKIGGHLPGAHIPRDGRELIIRDYEVPSLPLLGDVSR
jgi:hypothetical protein